MFRISYGSLEGWSFLNDTAKKLMFGEEFIRWWTGGHLAELGTGRQLGLGMRWLEPGLGLAVGMERKSQISEAAGIVR